jgi:hypothetical protein
MRKFFAQRTLASLLGQSRKKQQKSKILEALTELCDRRLAGEPGAHSM